MNTQVKIPQRHYDALQEMVDTYGFSEVLSMLTAYADGLAEVTKDKDIHRITHAIAQDLSILSRLLQVQMAGAKVQDVEAGLQ